MNGVKLLSNGRYHVMVTAVGGGYSHWKRLAVTRWREDAALDNWGTFCYLQDRASEAVWSTTLQPSSQRPEAYTSGFEAGAAVFSRRDHEIETRTEIAVSFDNDVELRRVRITNRSDGQRTLSATSFAEIVLAPPATDSTHPAFSKLFVQTEVDASLRAVFATRRPSKAEDPTPWLFHLVRLADAGRAEVSYETDRARFIGRGRSTADPIAMTGESALSGSAGPVLDAVAAIRVAFVLEPGACLTLDWISGIADSRVASIALARKHRETLSSQHILERAGVYRRTTLDRLQASEADARVYECMAASILYAGASLRADARVIEQNGRGQAGLWGFGISGDLALVLLKMTQPDRIDLVLELVRAHAFWLAHGIEVDLVILVAPAVGAEPSLADAIRKAVDSGPGADRLDKPAGIFIRANSKLDDGDRTLLQSVARIVVTDDAGTLAEQVLASGRATPAAPGLRGIPAPSTPPEAADAVQLEPPAVQTSASPSQVGVLSDFNGLGGFSADGREYLMTVSADRMTPTPWVNVLANPAFGTLVSESGSAATWSENAHEFRLTPWSNDPVSDANTEAIYIRDDATGGYWSPTLLPTRSAAPYVVRHGFGYSVFEHREEDIESSLSVHVAIDAPVKFCVLTLHNRSARSRCLSVTGYLDWVLGDERSKTLTQVVTEVDSVTGALFARNSYNADFAGRVAFFDVDDGSADVCGDRGDFFGDLGTLAAPGALLAQRLSGRTGAALDPCAALRVAFELAPGASHEVVFRLGAGKTADEARALVQRWRGTGAAQSALESVHAYWRRSLSAVQVRTPDASLNALANGWLVYQVIASRLWGRTAFYQSSGAFGFRDQLQDVMALVHAEPALVREHLLRSASRQFPEGDVQHWWHPPSGKGVRTRCSDDYLWLPFVACRYVEVTGDAGILDESCHFLESRLLKEGEESNYGQPGITAEHATLYEHCVRSIRHGLRYGEHGLPLMGSGDWSDGMNLVGIAGKGESVWLAFFLFAVLSRFAPLARARSDTAFADLCEREAAGLRQRIEASAWDGDWYQRAWFDDGSPLGTASNAECKIDSIAQSWAVLSGAADADRARRSMAAVDRRLVRRDARLIQLLDPPFDVSKPWPGYIQGYVPGVRENGGQYTHAAVWAVLAFAALGDADRAWETFAMLDPVRHGGAADDIAVYKVEPYVVAGDVYAFTPHAGRGGWTWYTGSAGWMYQLIVESLLGLTRSANQLRVRPLLPRGWQGFEMRYRFGASTYEIACRAAKSSDASGLVVDGSARPNGTVDMVDDGQTHSVVVDVWNPRR